MFTLVVALLLDPAAVLSLLAARRRGAHDAEIGTAIAAPLDDALTARLVSDRIGFIASRIAIGLGGQREDRDATATFRRLPNRRDVR